MILHSSTQGPRIRLRSRYRRRGLEALLFTFERIGHNIEHQPSLVFSIATAVTVGVGIAIAIIAASNGIENEINVLLGTHSKAEFHAAGINIDSLRLVLSQTRHLLTNLAIIFTASLVCIATWVTMRQRQRDIGIRRQQGEYVGTIICELLLETLLFCIIGGVLGILLGLGLCVVISHWLPLLPMSPGVSDVMTIFPATVVLSFLVTSGIALFFAIVPKTEPRL